MGKWSIANVFETRNTAGTAENPVRQQTNLCDMQINIKDYWQLYAYYWQLYAYVQRSNHSKHA